MNIMKIFGKKLHKKSEKNLNELCTSECSLPFICSANVKIPPMRSSVLQTSEGQSTVQGQKGAAGPGTARDFNGQSAAQTEDETEEKDEKPALPRPVETRISKGSDEPPATPESADVPTSTSTTEVPSTTSVPSTEEPTTLATAGEGDTVESEEERKQEEEILKAWGKSQEPKKLPIPTDYPDYMREVPELVYSETETSILRKKFNLTKIKSYEYQPLKRDKKKLRRTPKPRENLTSSLRKRFVDKQPIMSQHFKKHFDSYKRPPFKNTSLKLPNYYAVHYVGRTDNFNI